MQQDNKRQVLGRRLAGVASLVVVTGIVVQQCQRGHDRALPRSAVRSTHDPVNYMAGYDFYQPGPDDDNPAKLQPVGIIDPLNLPKDFSSMEFSFRRMETVAEKGADGKEFEVEAPFLYRKTYLMQTSLYNRVIQDAELMKDGARLDEYLTTHGGLLHSFNDQPSLVCIDIERNNIAQRCWTEWGSQGRANGKHTFQTPKYLLWQNSSGHPHRANGPAKIGVDEMIWYYNGHPHRTDGPAHVTRNQGARYYLNGKPVTPDQYQQWIVAQKQAQQALNQRGGK